MPCRHIVQELNKENLELNSRIRRAEAEKKNLHEECDELREAVRILEASVADEIKQLDTEGADAEVSEDVQKALRESKAKHEVCDLCHCDVHRAYLAG